LISTLFRKLSAFQIWNGFRYFLINGQSRDRWNRFQI
jgi:hypothetical protein